VALGAEFAVGDGIAGIAVNRVNLPIRGVHINATARRALGTDILGDRGLTPGRLRPGLLDRREPAKGAQPLPGWRRPPLPPRCPEGNGAVSSMSEKDWLSYSLPTWTTGFTQKLIELFPEQGRIASAGRTDCRLPRASADVAANSRPQSKHSITGVCRRTTSSGRSVIDKLSACCGQLSTQ